MSVSTPTLAPGTHPVPEAGAATEPPTTVPANWSTLGQALTRASAENYHTWLAHIHSAAGCAHPIRLAGELATIDRDTGQLLGLTRTEDLPDGVIYKACGNRRASACPTCAETYRRDAYELLRTGLVGGKTVPDSVAAHPAIFATLTAPSFGAVHTRRTTRDGRQLACRPRRQPAPCPHGTDLRCHRLHHEDEKTLGTPLCPDCYDHPTQVMWNNHAGELWRRTRINLDRHLTRIATRLNIPKGTIRLRYAKVAEMQRRGVIHFHLIIRLDGHHPDLPELLLPPPPALTTDHLHQALTAAANTTALTTQAHPTNPTGWPIGWGDQIDVRPIRLTGDGTLTDQAAAGYLAKYATKSTEATGHISRPLDTETIHLYANPTGTHPERLIHTAWTLGAAPGWRTLRRWAHMLGYGGHFLTKARHYSLTFTALRHRRTLWRRRQPLDTQHDQDTTRTLGWLTYIAAGWKTPGDALLANTAAALARERAQAAREAFVAAS